MATKKERVQAILVGEKADRLPVAFWRHWPGDDQDAIRLAEATVAFDRRYDWDMAKVTPSASYSVEDWGTRTRLMGVPLGEREYAEFPVKKPKDWLSIEALDGVSGALARQLKTISLVRAALGPDTPLLMTVFSPLAIARRLVGDEPTFLGHYRSYPDEVRQALEAITATYERFADAAIRAGADGLFYSTTAAAFSMMGEAEHRLLAMPYDLRILDAASGGWFNLLHLHSPFPIMSVAKEYPVHAVNWDDRTSVPPLPDGRLIAGKAVAGGINQWGTLQRGTPEDVRAEAFQAMESCGGKGMMLSGGCTYPVTVPEGNLIAARRVVEE
jgi:uroporphyrinogen decarboxylase